MRQSVVTYVRLGVLSLSLAVGAAGVAVAQDGNRGGPNTAGDTTGAPRTSDTRRTDDRGFDWGWLGLIGLTGLLGLRGLRRDDRRNPEYANSATTTARTRA